MYHWALLFTFGESFLVNLNILAHLGFLSCRGIWNLFDPHPAHDSLLLVVNQVLRCSKSCSGGKMFFLSSPLLYGFSVVFKYLNDWDLLHSPIDESMRSLGI